MKLDTYLAPHRKNYLKMKAKQNIRVKAIKNIEDNIREKLHDTDFDNHFLDTTLKAKAAK